jgi:hypothetical protein
MSDSSKSQEIEITPEMVEAGLRAYEAWEPEHIFSEVGAAEYAKRDLVVSIFQVLVGPKGPAFQRK